MLSIAVELWCDACGILLSQKLSMNSEGRLVLPKDWRYAKEPWDATKTYCSDACEGRAIEAEENKANKKHLKHDWQVNYIQCGTCRARLPRQYGSGWVLPPYWAILPTRGNNIVQCPSCIEFEAKKKSI